MNSILESNHELTSSLTNSAFRQDNVIMNALTIKSNPGDEESGLKAPSSDMYSQALKSKMHSIMEES